MDAPLSREKRLDSWKSIARYLGRSCRTVQRWQEKYGLPVRHVGGNSGSVFAYTYELENWLMRTFLEEGGPDGTPTLISAEQSSEPIREAGKAGICAEVPEAAREHSQSLVALANRMWRVLSYSNLDAVTKTFRSAIDHDCTNAAAFAGLASALIVKSLLGGIELQSAFTAAKAALRRSLELDANLLEARCMSGWLKILEERDWEGAGRALQLAMQERRLTSRVQIGMGLLRVAQGRVDDAGSFFQQASHQSALNSIWAEFNCWGPYLAGDLPRAARLIAQERSTGRSGPLLDSVEALVLLQSGQPIPRMEALRSAHGHDYPTAVLLGALAYAYAKFGHHQKAHELLRTLKTTRPSDQNHYAIAIALVGLKQNHEAVERLKLSHQAGSLWSLGFRSDPILRELRGCSYFCEFICRASYPAEAGEAVIGEDDCILCWRDPNRARRN